MLASADIEKYGELDEANDYCFYNYDATKIT